MFLCVCLRVDLCNFGWHAPPVGDQQLEVPPTALTGLAKLLTGLSVSLTLHRKREETMEPQLVITPWRAMLLPLSISSGAL